MWNPESGLFAQSPENIVDPTPDGDTVRQGFEDRLSPAMSEVYQDLNLLMKNGGTGLPDGSSIVAKNGVWTVPGAAFGGCIMPFSGTFGGSDGKRPIPKGGSAPQEAWALCDGTNGTPDLRERFVVGAGKAHAAGTTGGAKTHAHMVNGSVGNTTLAEWQMPGHTHQVPGGGWPGMDSGGTGCIADVGTTPLYVSYTGGSGAHAHALSVASDSRDSLPPYYALAYIMKL